VESGKLKVESENEALSTSTLNSTKK